MRSVTPESVKGLMVIEAVILGFLSYWMVNEYMYNANLREYANNMIGSHITTYTMIIGLAIGLAGTIAAFAFWRNLKETRMKLQRASTFHLKGSVRHALSALPTLDEETPLSQTPASITVTERVEAPASGPVQADQTHAPGPVVPAQAQAAPILTPRPQQPEQSKKGSSES